MRFRCVLLTIVAITTQALASVSVTSPKSGATVTSPVQYVASATSSTCSKGVASMGIYVNNVKVYVVQGNQLNTELTLGSGSQHTVVEEWDKCGGASTTTINLTVSAPPKPAITVSASPTSIDAGQTSVLSVTATNATEVSVSGNDGSSYDLGATGGKVTVSPAATVVYTATAEGAGGTTSATSKVTVIPAHHGQPYRHCDW